MRTEDPGEESNTEAILRSAAALFRSHRYDATSLRQIAEAVGLSKAGLYHYFSSKEQILELIAARAVTVLAKQLDEALSTGPPVEVLRQVVLGRVRTIAENQNIMAVFWQELPTLSDDLKSDLQGRLRRYRKTIRTVVEKGIRSGDISDDVDPHLVTLGLDGITGWCYLWFRPDGRLSAEEIGEAFWALLWQGLEPSA